MNWKAILWALAEVSVGRSGHLCSRRGQLSETGLSLYRMLMTIATSRPNLSSACLCVRAVRSSSSACLRSQEGFERVEFRSFTSYEDFEERNLLIWNCQFWFEDFLIKIGRSESRCTGISCRGTTSGACAGAMWSPCATSTQAPRGAKSTASCMKLTTATMELQHATTCYESLLESGKTSWTCCMRLRENEITWMQIFVRQAHTCKIERLFMRLISYLTVTVTLKLDSACEKAVVHVVPNFSKVERGTAAIDSSKYVSYNQEKKQSEIIL